MQVCLKHWLFSEGLQTARQSFLLRAADTPAQSEHASCSPRPFMGWKPSAGESYLERRMQIIPDGVVGVRAGEIAYRAAKEGRTIHVDRAVPAEADGVVSAVNSPRPDAVLSFAHYQSASVVLSGKRQAVVALGSGEVRIGGLLPLVQGLFAVLDRLSWYMGVEV
jgi:hypothetical protein